MIKCGTKIVTPENFPDGTMKLNFNIDDFKTIEKLFFSSTGNTLITWNYENDKEMILLYYLVKHLNSHNIKDIKLVLPYVPNARMDRVKSDSEVFTLKYFADFINSLNFCEVIVIDPHSYVSEALINNIHVCNPGLYIEEAIKHIHAEEDNLTLFYPDEGAMKRYSGLINSPYAFGIKKRDWKSGNILGLDVSGSLELIKNHDILIVDDICSKGGTFYHSAKKLKELGANDIYLYVTHCESTIFKGEMINSGLIKKIFTTSTLYKDGKPLTSNEMIEVFTI